MEIKADNNPGGLKEYYVLVDYDNFVLNVLKSKKRDVTYPLFDVVKQLDSKSDFFSGATAKSKVRVLLYGGWYYYDRQSFDAQNLVDLRGKSMTYYRNRTPLYVYFGLSGQMFSMTAHHLASPLYATFRSTPFVECPKCHTEKSGKDIRQKLVDTMLCCDLIYLSENDGRVAVVTADDDLVPPLLQQSILGKTVYHVLTAEPEPNSMFRTYYEPLFPDTCRKIIFER